MALTFGGATSDRVVAAAASGINNLSAFTLIFWAYPTTLTHNRVLFAKVFNSKRWVIQNSGGLTNTFKATVGRATVAAEFDGVASVLTTNEWQCIALTYDESDGLRGWRGTLTSAISEIGYDFRDTGSGSTTADNTGDFILANQVAANAAFEGRIACAGYYARRMTQAELRAYQFRMLVDADSRLLWQLGFAGTGTQPDMTGRGHSGTVTGATVSDHVPLGPIADFGVLPPYVVSAGAQTITPSAIASAEAFGTAKLNFTITASAIASAEAFGTHKLNFTLAPPGITSAEAFGSPQLNLKVAPASITTAEAFGTAKLNFRILPTGIASAETFGTHSLQPGAVTIVPSDIASAEAFGTPLVTFPGLVAELVCSVATRASIVLSLQVTPYVGLSGAAVRSNVIADDVNT